MLTATYAECHYAECHYAECHYAECYYAECHYAECHYAECHYAEVIMLSVIMLSVIMLSVIMLSVVAPRCWLSKITLACQDQTVCWGCCSFSLFKTKFSPGLSNKTFYHCSSYLVQEPYLVILCLTL